MQRALWRLCGAAAVRVLPVMVPAVVRGHLSRELTRFIGVPQALLVTTFDGHWVVRAAFGASGSAAGGLPA